MITTVFSSVILVSNNKNPNVYSTEYEFLWETLQDAPGYVEGDDSVVWGADLGPYYNYSELTNKLIELNNTFPEIVDLYSIGQSCFGKDLWMVRLTEESVRINKHGFIMIGQHHGREAITVMNSLYTIDRFISDYITNNNRIDEFGTSSPFMYYHGENRPPSIRSLLRDTEIFILPSLFPRCSTNQIFSSLSAVINCTNDVSVGTCISMRLSLCGS
ncbi:hypothetical protein LCGC14_3051180 [marine sediment metagenome]|uniref:Peptidase M14 domain-containing protein n=1 Tax=marine sediment metagenome TaxID=412755 RepID=A0A0F8WLK9_9ZZZZ